MKKNKTFEELRFGDTVFFATANCIRQYTILGTRIDNNGFLEISCKDVNDGQFITLFASPGTLNCSISGFKATNIDDAYKIKSKLTYYMNRSIRPLVYEKVIIPHLN